MKVIKHCLRCGKEMAEQPKFPGLWMCPDYKVALNDSPPFRYKCEGMELTGVGSEALERELFKIISERN